LRLLTFIAPDGTVDTRTVDTYDTIKKKWTTVQINQGIYVTAKDGTVVLASDGQKTWMDNFTDSGSDATPIRCVYTKTSGVYHFQEYAPKPKKVSKSPDYNALAPGIEFCGGPGLLNTLM